MIRYSEAVAVLTSLGRDRVLGSETVGLEVAVGRVLAADVISSQWVPPFNNSAMDGFALSSRWVQQASREHPVELRVTDTVMAGDSGDSRQLQQGSACEIMTGAPVPEAMGYDCVVKIEDVEVTRDREGRARIIVVKAPLKSGENVRGRGEDFCPGQCALRVGTPVVAEHLLPLATVGATSLRVLRRPRVAVLSTGRELMHASVAELLPGHIRNSTGPYLEAALKARGVEVEYLGVIPDVPAVFEEKMSAILARPQSSQFDLVVTTGAVSMGQADFIGESLTRLGAEVLFHKVAMRPGKPILCAAWKQPQSAPLFLGLPGNPISTAVGLRFFVDVLLRALNGQGPEVPILAELTQASKKPEGLRCFYKAEVEWKAGKPTARVLEGQASFMVSPLLGTNGWVVLPEEGSTCEAGARVQVLPLHPQNGWIL